jgi:tRNA-dihydrouridine synthase
MCIAEYYLNTDGRKLKSYTFEFDPTDRPLVLQLGGNKPDQIIKLANHDMFKGHVDALDINCGCPQSFALEKGYGCALLNKPDDLTSMCREIVQQVPYPVSVKLRLCDSVENTVQIMTKLKNVGVKAFTVHGRYYWQKGDKRGINDWDAIKIVREAFPEIPIVGNGDVTTYEDFQKFKQFSGVDSVMAGYGALLNPSVFSSTPIDLTTCLETYLTIARKHVNKLVDVQRHVAWMLKKHAEPDLKMKLFQASNFNEIQNVLHGLTPPVNINVAPLAEGEIDRIQYPRPRAEHKKRKREEMKNNKSPKLKFSRNNDNEKVPQENEDKSNETNAQDSDNNNMSISNLMNHDKNE